MPCLPNLVSANRLRSCDQVRIYQGQTLVAQHLRAWGNEQICYNPVHYLALLERKPGALDFAHPLEDWELPDSLHRLRRHLEAAHGDEGAKSYIGILSEVEEVLEVVAGGH